MPLTLSVRGPCCLQKSALIAPLKLSVTCLNMPSIMAVIFHCYVLLGCEYFKMSLDDFIHYDSVGQYIVHMSLRKRDIGILSRTVVHYAFLNYSCLGVAYCVCLDVTFLPVIVKLRLLTCVIAGIRFGLCLTYVLVYFLLS